MSLETLQKAFKLIELNIKKADFEKQKPESLIKSAEEVLELTFPPTYRAFLKQYGCGDIAGLEIYGVINEDFEKSGVPDGIWYTLSERKFQELPSPDYYFPHHLIIIADGGLGDWCVLDTLQKNADGENPVVIWEPGRSMINDKLEKIAEDFGDFLLKSIEAALQREE